MPAKPKRPVGWLPCGGYSGNRPATTMRPPARTPTAVIEPRKFPMAQVRKALDITANIDNNQGEIVLNGEIPDAWTDFLGANATMSNPQGWIANVDRTGQDQLTIRCLRRNGNAVEFVPQGTQVSFLLDLVGTN